MTSYELTLVCGREVVVPTDTESARDMQKN